MTKTILNYKVRRYIYIILLLCALSFAKSAQAQYYTWGSNAPMRWSVIRTPDVRVIYPDTASVLAQRTLFYIRSAQKDISYGFRHKAFNIPFVIHPENFQSNGLVMFMPKRVEFIASPAIEGYSMPWYKQLAAHEYRHAVQYNNLNRGVIRALSYIFGQQGSTVGLLYMPLWAIEGDAVMTETAMSSYGRGLQPSFSLAYRAIGDVGLDRKNIDRWFCGSYIDHIPDHYELGYQICSYAYERYGENVWDRVAWFASRNPYMFATTRIALERYYNTNTGELFRSTFDNLEQHWNSLPKIEESAVSLTELPERNYTTYQYPLPLDDTTVLVLKTDFARTSRFVRLDTRTGAEELICYTGLLSTRPVIGDGKVFWTEYRRSMLFDQRVNSQLCYMTLSDGTPRDMAGVRNALYPVCAGNEIAWVEYTPDGRYRVAVQTDGGEQKRFAAPLHSEIHGLAWDDGSYYVIVTDDSGMWLGRIDAQGVSPLTEGAYITISNLRAGGGKLYFGSIASGKDEVHCYDLATKSEYRITTSAYGSFMPAPWQNEKILLTTYNKHGYRVTTQSEESLIPVEPSKLPLNTLNPARKRWEVINLDTVRFTAADSVMQSDKFPKRRYRRLPNMINLHSWAPVAFNPFDAIEEQTLALNLGVTLLSQNLLSNTEAYTSYGWNSQEGSLLNFGLRYSGLGILFDIAASWGGNQQFYPLSTKEPGTGDIIYQPRPAPEKYYSFSVGATLPLLFQRGYHTRRLSFSTAWNYSNGMVAKLENIEWNGGYIANIEQIGFREGLHKLSFGVGFSDQVRMAHRDFAPRWSYLLSANYTLNPTNNNFSDLVSLYGQMFMPGFAPHNSLRVAAAYQTSIGGYKFPNGYAPLRYRSTRLIPRGFASAEILSNNYTAASLDYQAPIWYPEGGIPSVLYFKRIRLNIGGDYAQFRASTNRGMQRQRIWSVGGDIIFDVNLFRLPSPATSTVKLSLYHPSSGGVWFGAGVGLPF